MLIVLRIVGLLLLVMGFFTMYLAHKHGRLERWSIIGGICYAAGGLSGFWYLSWWPIIGGILFGGGIGSIGGVGQDRR